MNDHEKTAYLATLKNASLSNDARLRMRESLSTYADFHTVREIEENRSMSVMQNHSVFSLLVNARIMKATLAIALIVGLGGGTSYAAQQSVPGDILYPVKVQVNENIRMAFALNANTNAALQADLLQERLEEAKVLASRGAFEGEVKTLVQATIAAQVDKAIAASQEADAQVGSEVRVAVSDALRTFSNRLAVVSSGSKGGNTATFDRSQQMAMRNGTFMGGGMSGDVMMMSAFGTSELAGDMSASTQLEQALSRHSALQETIRAAGGMEAGARVVFESKLRESSELLTNAQMQRKEGSEASVAQNVQKAHEILGEIESRLSLMGSVTIDPYTGHIIYIDLSGNTNSGAGVSGSNGSMDFGTETGIDGEASIGAPQVFIDPMPAVFPLGQ